METNFYIEYFEHKGFANCHITRSIFLPCYLIDSFTGKCWGRFPNELKITFILEFVEKLFFFWETLVCTYFY